MQQATRSFRSSTLVYASRGAADGQGGRRFFNAQVFPRAQPLLFARLHLPYCTAFTGPSSLSIGLGISVVQHAAYFYAPYLIAHDACNLQDTTNVTNYQDTNITLQSIPQPIRIYDIRDMRNMMSDLHRTIECET